MSFMDLAAVSFHLHQEMESKVDKFVEKCDQAIKYLLQIKEQARGVVQLLNCKPSELKEQYIKGVVQLEEYMYIIASMNISLAAKLGEKVTNQEESSLSHLTPEIEAQPSNYTYSLNEPATSTSTAEKDEPKTIKKLSREQTVINMESVSSSNESIRTKSSQRSYSSGPYDKHYTLKSGSSTCAPNTDENQINGAVTCNVEKELQCNGDSFEESVPNTDENGINGDVSFKVEKEVQCEGVSFEETPPNNDKDDLCGEDIYKVEKDVQCGKVSFEELAPNMDENYDNSYLNKLENEIQCTHDSNEKSDVYAGSNYGSADEEKLPEQSTLEEGSVHEATILHVDSTYFWLTVDPLEELLEYLNILTRYYNDPLIQAQHMDLDQIYTRKFYAYFDPADTKFWYRGMIISYDEGKVGLFLVDIGEERYCSARAVRPLAEAFYDRPPYARCCHLAGVEFNESEGTVKELLYLLDAQLTIKIDDNTSGSLAVHVFQDDGTSLGDILVQKGFAHYLEEAGRLPATSASTCPAASHGDTQHEERSGPPEECSSTTSELQLLDMEFPEYEDPLEAVMGYSNRDEADICKHYKGGPEKTCFKGAKCTKKHIMHHPDGWTLDRVEVVGKCELLPLPAPDTWLRVEVTCVLHFDAIYVRVQTDHDPIRGRSSFGILPPPLTLQELIHDMNTPAQKLEYQLYTLAPAVGELVAAVYPCDGQYYRARVLTHSPADHNVEVFFLDYGNTMSISEDKVCMLPERYAALPAQAIMCRLAGVAAKTKDSKNWAVAKKALADLVLDRVMDAHVIARDYDEITVELFDGRGASIAEKLSASNLIELRQFQVIDDSHLVHRLVVP